MAKPSEKTIKRLFAMSGNLCAFPGCPLSIIASSGTVTGEICHIKAQNAGGPRFDPSLGEKALHAYENLILLCRPHHTIIDDQPDIYRTDVLEEIKAIREKAMGRPELASDVVHAKILLNALERIDICNNSGMVAIGSPGAVLTQTVNVKTTRRAVKVNAPPGTIGADQAASRYVAHLIAQYNEFAAADKSRATKFSYAAISKNIETTFRARWQLLSMENFEAVCHFLQQRISKTRIAKSNSAKGYPSFSTFEQFTAEQQ